MAFSFWAGHNIYLITHAGFPSISKGSGDITGGESVSRGPEVTALSWGTWPIQTSSWFWYHPAIGTSTLWRSKKQKAFKMGKHHITLSTSGCKEVAVCSGKKNGYNVTPSSLHQTSILSLGERSDKLPKRRQHSKPGDCKYSKVAKTERKLRMIERLMQTMLCSQRV